MIEIEARHKGTYRLSDEERSAVRRGLAEIRAGKIAPDHLVAEVFARHCGA